MNPSHIWLAVNLSACCLAILASIVDMIKKAKP